MRDEVKLLVEQLLTFGVSLGGFWDDRFLVFDPLIPWQNIPSATHHKFRQKNPKSAIF